MPDLRVLFVTSTPPIPTWGGAMAFYRHFIEQPGFAVAVVTDNAQVSNYRLSCPVTLLRPPAWLLRLQKTRVGQWAHAYQHLFLGRRVPPEALAAAMDFRPDLIVTVAGSWSWTTEVAGQLARKLQLPLVGSFNDWCDYSLILPSSLRARVERRFRKFYQECDLALCTCEGMKEALGFHPNSIVHYPTGAVIPAKVKAPPLLAALSSTLGARRHTPAVILFGGNLGDWYGPMLERLVTEACHAGEWRKSVDFVICGANPSWSSSFDRFVREQGIYRGQVPFARLQAEAASSDILLLLMGFASASAQVERTSFKTKFLDYLSFRKPIFVWGPQYSSAVRTATELDSAQVCLVDDPVLCLRLLVELAGDLPRQGELVRHASRMYAGRFNPEVIHQNLLDACRDLLPQEAS